MGTLETERDVAPADPVATCTPAEHVCRRCLARVLTRTADDGGTVARCSGCDIEAVGGPETICFCGALSDKFRVKFHTPVFPMRRVPGDHDDHRSRRAVAPSSTCNRLRGRAPSEMQRLRDRCCAGRRATSPPIEAVRAKNLPAMPARWRSNDRWAAVRVRLESGKAGPNRQERQKHTAAARARAAPTGRDH
jgi:hypothetical protein